MNRVLRLQQDHLSNQANPDLQQESGPSLQTAPLLEMHPDSPIPIQCLDSYLRAIDKKLKLLSDATMVVGTMKDMETESAGTITIKEGPGGPGPLQYLEKQKQVGFLQTHNQGFRLLFLAVYWVGPYALHGPCIFVVPEATHAASEGS